MENVWLALKTVGFIAAMILVCVGLPIWGATGSLERAWGAVKQYAQIMGWFVLIFGGLGLLAALAD